MACLRPLLLPLAATVSACAAAAARGRGAHVEAFDAASLAQLRAQQVPADTASPSPSSMPADPATHPSIPNIIHFTGPWEPNEFVTHNKKFVPKGTEFRYYSDAQLLRNAQEISVRLDEIAGVKGSFEAVLQLRPWAFRSDLWRLMVLWDAGGLYLDAKFRFTEQISTWVDQKKDGLSLCWDDDTTNGVCQRGFYNAVMAARAAEPKLLLAISHIIQNVKDHHYGVSKCAPDLDITGPGALKQALVRSGKWPHITCQMTAGDRTLVLADHSLSVDRMIIGIAEKNQGVLAVANQSVHLAMKHCKTCIDYQTLFKEHAIYCDEPFKGSVSADPCLNRDFMNLRSNADGTINQGARYQSWVV